MAEMTAGQGPTAREADDGPVLAADGTPLKLSLRRALRREKLRALMLIAPLLIFVLVTFIAPILDMLFRSVENQIVPRTLPRTVEALPAWDPASGTPGAEVFRAMYYDLAIAANLKIHTRVGSRLNYEDPGLSSLFRGTGRDMDEIGEAYRDQFEALDAAWEEPATWVNLLAAPEWIADQRAFEGRRAAADEADRAFTEAPPAFLAREGMAAAMPRTVSVYDRFVTDLVIEEEDSPFEEEPWDVAFTALHEDLSAAPEQAVAAAPDDLKPVVRAGATAVPDFQTVDIRAAFIESDEDWAAPRPWALIKTFSPAFTPGYYLSAVDMQLTPDGIAPQPETQQIYILLFKRTLFMSLTIMGACVLLGYPVAYLTANLPMRQANVLIILVLLPFWTSLLVRTSAWKVLLQQQGVINDMLVWLGLISDQSRLVMINNQFGTIVAMTHILLPFMILPLYSVMRTIPPSYVRAAKSLGATNWTAFWRVYFPQSVPGIGAGCILVFILSIGYYITPELVGGTTGTFISNRIAYHISTSLNWGLAAALGTILLVVVVVLYWVYDKIVGIDNVSLG